MKVTIYLILHLFLVFLDYETLFIYQFLYFFISFNRCNFQNQKTNSNTTKIQQTQQKQQKEKQKERKRKKMQTNITIEEIANLFYAADQDNNGSLSFDEIAIIMTTIKGGIRPSDDEIRRCMNAMDSNGDGSISEQEFLQAMISWLGIINNNSNNNKKRSLDTPHGSPTLNRKKTVSDMTNFFRQFSPIPDFQEEQRRILLQESKGINLTSIHREYQYFTSEEKSVKYEIIKRILIDGRDIILQEINSYDWNIVLNGVLKVQSILSIVELFSTPEERFIFIFFLFYILLFLFID